MDGFNFIHNSNKFNISYTIFTYFFINNDSITNKDAMVSQKYLFDRVTFYKLAYSYSVFHYLGDINFKCVTFYLPKDIDFYKPINMLDRISILGYFSDPRLYMFPSADLMKDRAD